MYNVTDDIIYIGVNDNNIDLFEGLYSVPDGVTYNSYLIKDEKVAVTDTVDGAYIDEWLNNIKAVLGDKSPDYLIVHHMEPDHSAGIARFIAAYPAAKIVGNSKTLVMIKEYFGCEPQNFLTVGEGATLSLGKRALKFVMAPMVHWPEVMVTYDSYDKAVFSADAFGSFGTTFGGNYTDEMRRYYIGIVGKYGVQVQGLLKKLSLLEVDKILPLHGRVLTDNVSSYISLYDTWSSYKPEKSAVMVAYASIYGHTAQAAKQLAEKLKAAGTEVFISDLARTDWAQNVALAFACDRLVLASVTYNAEIYPPMREFIDKLCERGYKNRTVGFIENGTWAPMSAKLMRDRLAPCKNLTFTENTVKVRGALNSDNAAELDGLCTELLRLGGSL